MGILDSLLLEEYEEDIQKLKLLKLLKNKSVHGVETSLSNVSEVLRPYVAKIEFTESAKGNFQFTGYMHFDDISPESVKEHINKLADMVLEAHKTFAERGLKLARDSEKEKEKKEVVVNKN